MILLLSSSFSSLFFWMILIWSYYIFETYISIQKQVGLVPINKLFLSILLPGITASSPPILISSPHLLCWFFFCNVTEPYGLRNDTCFLSIMSQNFMDYATIPFFFLLPKCYGTSRIVQRCLLLISGMSRNFTDCLTMGVKFLEAVKRRLHAIKQWSPDKIRVWQ